MSTNRHSDEVRAYLDYLCETPDPSRAIPWREWVKGRLGGRLLVGLTMTLAACGGESDNPQGGGGTAGTTSGGMQATTPSNGGASNTRGGSNALPNGGKPATTTISTGGTVYGVGGTHSKVLARALHRDPPAGGSRNWPTLICLMRFRNSRAENWVGA